MLYTIDLESLELYSIKEKLNEYLITSMSATVHAT